MPSSFNPNALNERIFSLLSNILPLSDQENQIRRTADSYAFDRSAALKADSITENIGFLIKYHKDLGFDPCYVDAISFYDTNHQDSTKGLTTYVMVLTHGKEHVSIVAQAWVEKTGQETLAYRLHQNVLADAQRVYQPLGESIENRKIKKGKGAGGSSAERAKKSLDIVLQDQTGSDVNNRAFI